MKYLALIMALNLPAFAAVQWLSVNPSNDVGIAGIRLQVPVNTIDANGDPIGHSGLLSTPKKVIFQTNTLYLWATNRVILGTFSNYYTGNYSKYTNNATMSPVNSVEFDISFDGGATWKNTSAPGTNCLVSVAAVPGGDNSWLSNVVIYGYTPAAAGNTLDFFNQFIFCDSGTDSRSVANLGDVAAAAWWKAPALARPDLNSKGITIDANWSLKRDTAQTNGNALAFFSGNQNALTLLSAAGGTRVAYSVTLQVGATNLLFIADAAGMTSAPAIIYSTNISLAVTNWSTATQFTNWSDGVSWYVSVAPSTNAANFYRMAQTFSGQTNVSAAFGGQVSAPGFASGGTAGISTNISLSGSTFFFTNGLLWKFSTP